MIGSPQQERIWDEIGNGSSHVIVQALAGTGKTTTIVEGLKRLPPPSPAGRRVVSSTAAAYGFVAFNKSIANELKTRVPAGVDASTMHSMGFAAIRQAVRRVQVDKDKVFRYLTNTRPSMAWNHVRLATRLVSLCKYNLIELEAEFYDTLDDLCLQYGIEIPPEKRIMIYDCVPDAMQMSRSVKDAVDFDDMVWLPVVENMEVPKYKQLFVDEVQDLNPMQRELVLRAGERIVLVGDRNQSIYGFAGADMRSMDMFEEILGDTRMGITSLPLTVTRRCARAITAKARTLVPTFECMETAPEGVVDEKYRGDYEPGQFILCRNNAPLISLAYSLISQDIPLKIQGRDIGEQLANYVKRLAIGSGRAITLNAELLDENDNYRRIELAKVKPGAPTADDKIQLINDKCDCVEALTQGLETVEQVLVRISNIFDDVTRVERGFVLLSSVHKAKGLEADTVQIIEPKLMPARVKNPEQMQQERNLMYVAWTRAKNTLGIRGD